MRTRDVVYLIESLFLSTCKYVTRTEMLSIEADLERSKSLFVVKAILSVTNLAFDLASLFMNVASGYGYEHRRQGVYNTLLTNQNAWIQHSVTADFSRLPNDRAKFTKLRVDTLALVADRNIALIGTEIRSYRTGAQVSSEGKNAISDVIVMRHLHMTDQK